MFRELIRRLQCKKENTSSDVNAFKESDSKKPEKEQTKLKWNCPNCDFHWDGHMETFERVLAHEKTHSKNIK